MKRALLVGGIALALLAAWLAWNSRGHDSALKEPSAPEVSKPAAPSGLAPDTSAVQARDAEGHDRTAALDRAPAAPSPTPAVDSAQILVRGSVRDEQDQPVPGMWIRWTDEQGIEAGAAVENGAYAAAGMRAGNYIVTLASAGWRQEQIDVTLDAQPAVQQRDFTAHTNARILIRIVSTDGAPLIGFDAEQKALPGNELLVYTTRGPPPNVLDPDLLVRQAASDFARFTNRWSLERDGQAVSADCLGQVELLESPPLSFSLVRGNARIATREITDVVPAEIVFTLGPDEVRARKSGLRVRLLQADGRSPVEKGYAMLFALRTQEAVGDAEGVIEIRDLAPGRYALSLGGTGKAGRKQDIVLTPGETLDLGDIVLGSGPKLSIRFDFPGDEGPQVLFVVKPEHAGDPLGTLGAYDNTNFGNGSKNPYSLSLFAPGSYEFRVTGLGDPMDRNSLKLGARPQRVVLTGEATTELVVKIAPLTEISLRPPRNSMGPSRWLISTNDGLPCQRVRIEGRAPARASLVPGEYVIMHIDGSTNALGKPLAFSVGSTSIALELLR